MIRRHKILQFAGSAEVTKLYVTAVLSKPQKRRMDGHVSRSSLTSFCWKKNLWITTAEDNTELISGNDFEHTIPEILDQIVFWGN